MSRSFLTTGLFVALGGVAIAALAALFAPGTSIAGRLTGTSVILGLGCLAFLPMTRQWQQGAWTPFLRAYVAVVPSVAVIGTVAIWWTTFFGPSVWMEWRLGWLALLLVAWLVMATLPLRMMNSDRVRRAGLVALVAISTAFAIWVLAIFELIPTGDGGGRGWVVLIGSPVFGALSLPIPAESGRSVWRPMRWLGLAAAIGAVGLLFVELPWNWTPDHRFEHWSLAVGLAAGAITVATGVALESAMGPPWRRWVHRATVGVLALEGALVTMTVDASLPVADRWETVLVSLGLLTLVGIATSAVLDAAGRAAERARGAVAMLSDVRLTCPRCGRSHVFPLGVATPCDRCGLIVEVRVQQDRCLACGYSRTGLATGTACPECGAPGAEVTAGDRR